MRTLPMPLAVALATLPLLTSACSNPDNLVVGGISATSTQPVAIINNVQSAISGVATVYDSHGNKTTQQLSVIALSGNPGLCAQLAAHPDYFRNAPETYVTVVLFAPPDRVGTFYIGAGAGVGGEVIAADGPALDGGTPADAGTLYPTTPYPAAQGQIDFQQFDVRSPGQATGNFDIIVGDAIGGGHEYYGRFKTTVCDALGAAMVP